MQQEQHVYTFGELNILAKRPEKRALFSWFMKCTDCHQEIRFIHRHKKMWIAKCNSCKLEFTITPSEYYTRRNIDFSQILIQE